MDAQTGLSSRVRDFLRRMDEMVEYARRNQVDLAIFAGDAFKSQNPNPTFQREFAFRIRDLIEMCPVVLLVGNHDLPSVEARASSIEIYETLQVPNVTVGRDYAAHTIQTRRGPVLVATAPYPHVVRGGSYDDPADRLRSAARRGSDCSWKMRDPQLPKSIWWHSDAPWVGFRIVRPFKVPPPDQLRQYWTSGVERD
jgi:DNA repair exonuclease SbcCD nuclease subunit